MRKNANSTTISAVTNPTPRIGTVLLAVAAAVATAGAIAILVAYVRPAESTVRVAFTLTDQSGATVSQNDLAGRHLLVFFGFTHCAQICPTQMSKLTAAMTKLDRSGHAGEVTPVFVSVDPERDTPMQVARFLTRFDRRFVGLTGPRTALTEAAASFKAYLHSAPPTAPPAALPAGTGDYQVVHATTVYIVDPQSRIVGYVAGSDDAEAIAAQVRKALG